MPYILIILIIFSSLLGKEHISPIYKIQASSMVTDIKVYNKHLFASTDLGTIEVFNLKTKKLVHKIKIPKIKDYLGDFLPSKVYSIDIIDNKILIVAQSTHGKRNLYVYKDNKLQLVEKFNNKYLIRKALYINESQVLLGLISSEIILYDMELDKVLYKKFVVDWGGYGSVFKNMKLSEDKKTLAIGNDSAIVNIFNTSDFSLVKSYKGQNVNKILDIDYKKGTIITGGKDRRCAVYKDYQKPYFKKGEFFIYTVALNPSATKGIYVGNFDNNIEVFDIKNEQELYLLKGHYSIPTDFEFIGENEFFSSDESGEIIFWEI